MTFAGLFIAIAAGSSGKLATLAILFATGYFVVAAACWRYYTKVESRYKRDEAVRNAVSHYFSNSEGNDKIEV